MKTSCQQDNWKITKASSLASFVLADCANIIPGSISSIIYTKISKEEGSSQPVFSTAEMQFIIPDWSLTGRLLLQPIKACVCSFSLFALVKQCKIRQSAVTGGRRSDRMWSRIPEESSRVRSKTSIRTSWMLSDWWVTHNCNCKF